MQQVSGGQPEGVNAVWNGLETFLAALRQMADEDMDFVVKTCAGAVQRQQGTNGAGIWAPIFDPRSGMFMFEDINLLVVFDITSQVVRDKPGWFFSYQQRRGWFPSNAGGVEWMIYDDW